MKTFEPQFPRIIRIPSFFSRNSLFSRFLSAVLNVTASNYASYYKTVRLEVYVFIQTRF